MPRPLKSRIPQDEWRLLALATIGFALAAFIIANEKEGGESAWWYIGLITFASVSSIWVHGNQGIGPAWKKNAFYGAMFSLIFVAMHMWQPAIFNLGLPNAIGLSEQTKFILIALLAPIGEEYLFRHQIFKNILRNKYEFLPAALITSAIFSAFHMVAYGSASAAFIGAFSFGMIAAFETEETHDIAASTVTHMAVNAFLLISPAVVLPI